MQNSPIKVTLEPIGLREKPTQVLRDAILNLHFRPGQKLVERALCEGTGVSRTCIREALRHLEAEGLVSRLPNRGTIVAEVGADEARQIYESRAVLEAAMAHHFAERADAEDFAMLILPSRTASGRSSATTCLSKPAPRMRLPAP